MLCFGERGFGWGKRECILSWEVGMVLEEKRDCGPGDVHRADEEMISISRPGQAVSSIINIVGSFR